MKNVWRIGRSIQTHQQMNRPPAMTARTAARTRTRIVSVPRPRPAPATRARRGSLSAYLEEQRSLLHAAVTHVREASEKGPLSHGAEWLLDNFYLVQQSLRGISEDMPESLYRQLPRLTTGPLEGYPCIDAVAQELVVTSEARLDMDRVEHYVRLFQAITPLSMRELWALPVMLRLSILECLTQAITRITGLQREHPLPATMLPHPITDDAVVANCIGSLRSLAVQDWQLFFESVSRVEQVLRDDPPNIYARMDRPTARPLSQGRRGAGPSHGPG